MSQSPPADQRPAARRPDPTMAGLGVAGLLMLLLVFAFLFSVARTVHDGGQSHTQLIVGRSVFTLAPLIGLLVTIRSFARPVDTRSLGGMTSAQRARARGYMRRGESAPPADADVTLRYATWLSTFERSRGQLLLRLGCIPLVVGGIIQAPDPLPITLGAGIALVALWIHLSTRRIMRNARAYVDRVHGPA